MHRSGIRFQTISVVEKEEELFSPSQGLICADSANDNRSPSCNNIPTTKIRNYTFVYVYLETTTSVLRSSDSHAVVHTDIHVQTNLPITISRIFHVI